ncbi:Structural maintenance of chromosomes protein 5 [Ascosphaera pollenicola]|nr:Structural maintenance of chromosomes protein 5 [Ascosphaera pollenicola]
MGGHHRRRRVDDSSDESDDSSHDSKRVKFEGRDASVELGGDVPPSAPDSEFQTATEGNDSDGEDAKAAPDDDGNHDDGTPQPNAVLPVRSRQSKSEIPHSPGAIVRVRLTNFVTYSSAEFHPGPLLNMIIGPNGTGKSTFVLGRAKDVADFVKHGCRQAAIEIELQGRPGKRNPVITRIIKREGSKSVFHINNQTVPQKKVLELAKSYAIQIDNLCQFLPQDKVAEFAAMTPVELLKSTQRAAAPPQMLQWHEELIELRKQQKEALTNHATHKELLTSLERRHDMQREDVERMRQREQIKNRIKALEMCRPLVQLKDLSKRTSEAKKELEDAKKAEAELKEQVAPMLASANSKKEYCDLLEVAARERRKAVSAAEVAAEAAKRESKALEDKIEQLSDVLKNERKRGEAIQAEKQRCIQQINKVNRQLEEEPPEFDAAAFNERLRDIVRQIRVLEEKQRECASQHEEANESYRKKNKEIQSLEYRYTNLESQAGQQEEKLRRLSQDTYNAYQWIKKNQQEFQQPVFGPPIVECSLRDMRYADVVESYMGRSDFMAFTTQSASDFRTMQRAFAQNRWQDVTIRTCTLSLNDLRSPVSDGEVKQLGFDCWLKDLVSGPEPVLAMLCSESGLSSTPVTLREMSDAEYKTMESHPRINNWISGLNVYSVTRRREYGPGASSTRVKPVQRAKWWTNQPVDSGAKIQIEQSITRAREELTVIERTLEDVHEKKRHLSAEIHQLHAKENAIKNEKDTLQRSAMHFRGLPDKKANHEAKLQAAEEAARELRRSIQKTRNKQDKCALEQVEATIRYSECIPPLRKALEACFEADIKLQEGRSDYEMLNARNREINDSLAAMKRTAENSQAEYTRLNTTRRTVKREVEAFQRAIAGTPEEEDLRRIVGEVQEYSPVELEGAIDSGKAELDLIFEGSTDMITEFEHREICMGRLKSQIEEETTALAEVDEAIRRTRAQWEPELEKLVVQISAAFSDSFARIGCAGQVSVNKAEDPEDSYPAATQQRHAFSEEDQGSGSDFDRWSIQIMVKFRESEPLSILDAHRQSGGERAVSTIFYLMALQSLSKSPFRVVDEINQGMDPRNERMVHERMVDIACDEAEDTGRQYFLITPKLLTGLAYRDGMQVSCVLSGEFMQAEHEKLSAPRCIANAASFIRKTGLTIG